jgi:polyisoprenoid-binding protein YceI
MTRHWKIDPSHSEVEFKVKHLMITTITGHFTSYKLNVTTNDDDFTSTSEIVFLIDVNSISTNNQQRDDHLKSAEFLDSERYPEIIFKRGRLKV